MVVVGQRARIGADHRGEMRGAAVGKVVAIDRGDDDMGEAELCGGVRDMGGLRRIKRAGQAGLDVAEGTGARAGVAHDHEGRVLFVPALADIGAAGFLAHGVQAVHPHDLARCIVAGRHRRLDANPVRLARRRLIRPVRLFRMPGPAGNAHCIDDDRHGGSARRFAAVTYGSAGGPARRRVMTVFHIFNTRP